MPTSTLVQRLGKRRTNRRKDEEEREAESSTPGTEDFSKSWQEIRVCEEVPFQEEGVEAMKHKIEFYVDQHECRALHSTHLFGHINFVTKPEILKNNMIDKETIEGVAIESFIEKYNLSTEWINEGWQWGGTDENGTFIGIIGRVRLRIMF